MNERHPIMVPVRAWLKDHGSHVDLVVEGTYRGERAIGVIATTRVDAMYISMSLEAITELRDKINARSAILAQSSNHSNHRR